MNLGGGEDDLNSVIIKKKKIIKNSY